MKACRVFLYLPLKSARNRDCDCSTETSLCCILQFARLQFNNGRRWYCQFKDTGRPKLTKQCVERGREPFIRTGKKSTRKSCHGLAIPLNLNKTNKLFLVQTPKTYRLSSTC